MSTTTQARYIVTEVEGWMIRETIRVPGPLPGLSVQVIDTHWNHRIVATLRTENVRGNYRTREQRREFIRTEAALMAARLNRDHARTLPLDLAARDDLPACPRCGDLCEPDADRCPACNKRLWPAL